MLQSLNRLRDALMAVVFAFVKRSNAPQPLPPPPPLPPGVPPTPPPVVPPPYVPPPASTPLTLLLAGFLGHYQNQFVDLDGAYGAQCVDECNAWMDWIGLRRFPLVVGAADLAARGLPFLVWIANNPTNIPPPGATVIWGRSPTLPWGHCATMIRGDQMHLFTFDQNWPYGSRCHEQAHTYQGIAGWYIPVTWKGKSDYQMLNPLRGK